MKTFHRFNIANLIFTLAVIGWGAFVRASGSGAGCGAHWPLCNGEVIPMPHRIQTVIEFLHRATSGISLTLVLILFLWSRRVAVKGSVVRFVGGLAGLAIVMEALLGASLVLLKLVEFDQSAARAISISLHLVNTLFLLSTLATMTWITRSGAEAWAVEKRPMRMLLSRDRFFWFTLAVFGLLGITGAITALGDTLFPSTTLAQGMASDFSDGAHFLLKLRIIHPILAFTWIFLAFVWSKKLELSLELGKMSPWRNTLILGVTVQFILGMMNWVLMAPSWMQVVHLLVGDLVYITFWISGLDHEARKSFKSA